MNILQLVPKLNIGGVEKGTVEVAKALTLGGHKAVVASAGGAFEKSLAAIGARHYKIPVGKKNPFVLVYAYFQLVNVIKKENIDIVHARSRIPALVGYFAARHTHRTFITTAHGQYKKHLISKVMGWGKTVITANETMARYMNENFGVPIRKISIIPRGVDLKRFSFVPLDEKDNKTFRVGMICRFTPLKGHLDFLKAISYVSRRIPNMEVILMGDIASAKDEYIKKLELSIRRLMIGNIVKFVDSNEDVAEVMKNLDVLVSANQQQEAFGRTIIEAQARGTAVVATKVGGVVENVIEGETGLVCMPMDPSSMSDKILSLFQDKNLYRKVAEGGRKFVEENYSLKNMMERTLEVYAKILKEKNILIFKISSLGDIMLSVPSIRAIRNRFPETHIKVLVDVKFREVLDGCPYIDEVIACDFNSRDKGIGFWRLARRLRSEDFDISIDFQNNRKSHLLAFFSAIPDRYGFDNGKWSVAINRKTHMPKKAMTPVEHQGCVLGLLGITRIDPKLELWSTPENEQWVQNFLNKNWVKPDEKLVAISISASRKWQTKNWPINSAVKLVDMLAEKHSIRVVLLGAEEDSEDAKEFIKKTGAKPVNAVGMTNISRLISLIKRCNVLLTGDSAPMHIASSVNTPFVALFGPTDPRRHLEPSDSYRLINKEVKCSPCYKSTCSRNLRCMNAISVEEVHGAVMELLS